MSAAAAYLCNAKKDQGERAGHLRLAVLQCIAQKSYFQANLTIKIACSRARLLK